MITIPPDLVGTIRNYFHKENCLEEGIENSRAIFFEFLKRHYLIKTGDGSYTVKSAEFLGNRETMHDTGGGFEEAYEKFVLPCKVKDRDRILDVCSGLGYNAASALMHARDLEIHMIESSKEVLALSLIIEVPEEYREPYDKLRSHVEEKLKKEGFLKHCINHMLEGDIEIFIEDARKVVTTLKKNSYDAVFFDPFSPKISPELYTVRFLKELKGKMKKKAILTSYSASLAFRASLIEAGFTSVWEREIGGKCGTLASRDLIEYELPREVERLIALSDIGVPLRGGVNEDGIITLKRRDEERLKVRGRHLLPSTKRSSLYLGEGHSMLSRRVLREFERLGLDTQKSRYVVCPQFLHCICNSCSNRNWRNSVERVIEMRGRILKIQNKF